MRAALAVLLALATLAPRAGADPVQCDYAGTGDIWSGEGIEARQESHSCHGPGGSQTTDHYEMGTNRTDAIGRHNVSYWAESDTGYGYEPYWCSSGAGTWGTCSSLNATVDGKGFEAHYWETQDGARCSYQMQVLTGTGRATLTLPIRDPCFNAVALAP